MADLSGKSIIVTGGGRGIGYALAQHFAEQGASLTIAEYNPDTADSAGEQLRAAGHEVSVVVADVRKRDDVTKIVDTAIEKYGRVDGVVNNAQISTTGIPFTEATDEQLFDGVDSGAFGSVRLMQAVFPYMKAQGGGSIVNVVSSTALQGFVGGVGYVASKGAIMAITRTAAREWGQFRIRVNAYAPTAMSEAVKRFSVEHPEQYQAILAPIPFGRLGDPLTDVAPAVGFLLSDDSAFVTGQMFAIDGGQYISPL